MISDSVMQQIQAGELRITPTYGYYRQPNGWITMAVVTELEELHYRREGWEPLPEYGRFDMGGIYAANHPLEVLFMRGGAKELCLEQIIDSGLYLNPPLLPVCGRASTQFHKVHDRTCWVGAKPVRFPQLDGLDLDPNGFPCRFCEERPPFPTPKARDQHEGVMHKDKIGNILTGEVLAESLIRGLGVRPAESPSQEQTAPPPHKSLPYACGFCYTSFKSPVQLARHVKEHKANGEAA